MLRFLAKADTLVITVSASERLRAEKTTSFFSPKDTHGINTARTVEVWMDDYKNRLIFYEQARSWKMTQLLNFAIL